MYKSGWLWVTKGNKRANNKRGSWGGLGGGSHSQLQQRRKTVEQDFGEGRHDSESFPSKLWLNNTCDSIPWEDGWGTICSDKPYSLAFQHWHAGWAVRVLSTLFNGCYNCTARSFPNESPGWRKCLLFLSWSVPPSPNLFLPRWCTFWRSALCGSSGVPLLCRTKKVAWPDLKSHNIRPKNKNKMAESTFNPKELAEKVLKSGWQNAATKVRKRRCNAFCDKTVFLLQNIIFASVYLRFLQWLGDNLWCCLKEEP